MGSGSLAAMSVFETQWKPKLNKEEAIALTSEAIKAGIFNDLGSGSNVDVCVIQKGRPTQMLRNYMKPNERGQKERSYRFPRGTTAWLDQKVISKAEMSKYVTVEELTGNNDSMEVDT